MQRLEDEKSAPGGELFSIVYFEHYSIGEVNKSTIPIAKLSPCLNVINIGDLSQY